MLGILRVRLIIAWDRFRAKCQRFKRGYSYGDVWDLYLWFIWTVEPMLRHLAAYGIGYPNEYTEDEWHDKLIEMADLLHNMDEDNLEQGDIPDGEWYKKEYEILEENKDKFFELFSKEFFNLWD